MKKPEEVMEILEAYDLTGSFRQAAALVECDHKTVAYWVRLRDEAGGIRRSPRLCTSVAAPDPSGGRGQLGSAATRRPPD